MREAWTTLVERASERPRDFLFVAAAASHALADKGRRERHDGMERERRELLVHAVVEDAAADVPAQALVTSFVAPARQPARDAAVRGQPADPRVASQLFDMIRRGLHGPSW